ncbi:MAG: hypothetical protein HY828_20555 [Actinobacteria bacterium]|nr:hypothetical protein [Actinomycetota bacterium]
MNDRRAAWAVRAALALPFLVALVALARTHWVPVLDLAMTELRVRDVFGAHTPLIGLPGRIGNFPDQGSHPGPLSFYLLWPVYRLFGGSAYGLLVGAAVINVGAAWTAVWIAGRRGGRRLMLGVGAVLMVVVAWLGASVLTQPWNPYLPLVSFVVVLLAAWSVLDGDHLMLVPLVGFSTLCAQTHVPYLALCVVLCAVAIGVVVWRRDGLRSLAFAVGLGAVLWLPVFIDEIRHDPGNITMLRRHFLSPPEDPVGFGVGVKTVLAHFDITRVLTGTVTRNDDHLATLDDLAGGRWAIGAVVLLVWIGAFVVAWRLRDRRLVRLHTVVAVGVAVAVLSTGRIFGKVWYYLTLWSWSIALLAVAASVWTAIVWWERRDGRPLPLARVAVAVLVVAGVFFVKDAAMVDPPEPRLSRSLDAVLDDTAAALTGGVGAADGKDGVYAVVWNDAYYVGSQGYGLISELERRGFDARAYETYRVPVTPHRITDPSSATAEVVFATGINVAAWRDREGAVEVAFFEPRSADELAEFDRLHDEVMDELAVAGLDDVAEMVDSNLFGASLDPRVPAATEQKMARMLVLGQETAVFIAPAGTF